MAFRRMAQRGMGIIGAFLGAVQDDDEYALAGAVNTLADDGFHTGWINTEDGPSEMASRVVTGVDRELGGQWPSNIDRDDLFDYIVGELTNLASVGP